MRIIKEQQDVIARILSGENLALICGAGKGKSWIVNQVKTENTVLVSPTGAGALNIGGVTAHSCFGLSIGYPVASDWNKLPKGFKDLFGHRSKVDRIILDECGMLSVYYLDMIDHKLRLVRGNDLPFGGIQIVMVGDFFQIPPIVKKEERPILLKEYTSEYIFDSKVWQKYNFPVVQLSEVVRQSDAEQIALLSNIREGIDVKDTLVKITNISAPYVNSENTLHLTFYNADADHINKHWYSHIKGKETTYTGIGNDKVYPIDKRLKLKIGTKVIICANDPEGSYVNGNRGTIVSFLPDSVGVQLGNGDTVYVTAMTWQELSLSSSKEGKLIKTIKSEYTQIPLKLGWAISTHRAQGTTLESAALDVGRGGFAAGLAYVAMSRVKDLRNLSFVNPISPKDIIVNKRVKEWLGGLK